MRTEIYEADPFTAKRSRLLATIESDYRFEKNDEMTLDREGEDLRLRVTHIRVRIKANQISREITALKL